MTQRGFTLIEVLIAVAITAIVAAASYSGIATVLNGSEQLRAAGDRTRDLNRAMTIIDRDLRQFINRPVRDEFGQLQPAIAGGPLAFFALSLTREGWHNGLARPRADLQRVHYYLEEDALWRAYHRTLDRVVDAEPQRVQLLDGVEEIELRFLEDMETLQLDRDLVVDTTAWARNWIADPSVQALRDPPLALELRLQLTDVGELRRLYVFPTP
jgi:general secretion pathway protein J